jgi:catechol 2,3-dioxygenase-like lactoylglutathione lyase family enzyme
VKHDRSGPDDPALTMTAVQFNDGRVRVRRDRRASAGDAPHSKGATMAMVIFGNHTAVRVSQAERDKIRAFYRDVLGCTLMREFDDKDDFRMGGEFYFAFLYESGRGVAVDEGVSYAAADALSADDFLKAIFLELKTDDVDEMRRRIIAFGVRVLEVPDPHLYFQAPGGQVFRLVGIGEDLSKYEGSEPGAQRNV